MLTIIIVNSPTTASSYTNACSGLSDTTYTDAVFYIVDSIGTTRSDFTELFREIESYERYLRSRDWSPAPVVIKPTKSILSRCPMYARILSPKFWTGKNFKK